VAVVFDWALTAQLTTQAVAALTGHLGVARDPLAVAGRIAAALLLLGLGEGLRRGVRWVRVAQLAIMGLITALGVATAALLVAGRGDRSQVPSAVIELTYAPWLVWRLASAGTAAWFAQARGRGGAPRTSGAGWVVVLAAWAVGWGVGVAWSQSL
jgi:hypothetical protein